MTAGVLKQDPNTKKVQTNVKTQGVLISVETLRQADQNGNTVSRMETHLTLVCSCKQKQNSISGKLFDSIVKSIENSKKAKAIALFSSVAIVLFFAVYYAFYNVI